MENGFITYLSRKPILTGVGLIKKEKFGPGPPFGGINRCGILGTYSPPPLNQY